MKAALVTLSGAMYMPPFSDDHVYGGVAVGQKLCVERIILSVHGGICHCHGQCRMNLRDEIVGVGVVDVLRDSCQLVYWKMNTLTLPRQNWIFRLLPMLQMRMI